VKKLVFYSSRDCEDCEEAKEVVSEIASEFKVQLEERDVTNLPSGKYDVPSVCIVDEAGEEKCVLGFIDAETLREELRKLVGKVVV